MKAISIKQPWASLIAHGIKDIENRTWRCPKKYPFKQWAYIDDLLPERKEETE